MVDRFQFRNDRGLRASITRHAKAEKTATGGRESFSGVTVAENHASGLGDEISGRSVDAEPAGTPTDG